MRFISEFISSRPTTTKNTSGSTQPTKNVTSGLVCSTIVE